MIQATQLSGGSLGTMVLGLAASLLALAVFVQVVQEIYKFLTSSKSRAYANALRDYLGPWSATLLKEGLLNDLKVRGPFQIGSRTPRKWLLPLSADSLQGALEATVPPWCQRMLQSLNLEASLDAKKPPSSPNWNQLVGELREAATTDAPGNGTAKELVEFVDRWSKGNFAAPAILTGFRDKFLPHVDAAVAGFPQLMQQFDFAYRRRNLRQTFLLGFLVAFIGGYPIGVLYRKASAMTAAEAQSMAEAATSLADKVETRIQARARLDSLTAPDTAAITSDSGLKAAKADLDTSIKDASSALKLLRGKASGDAITLDSFKAFWGMPLQDMAEYLAGCLMTALLLSFGAPFWNDLTKSLMKVQKQADPPANSSTGSLDS
jgi:hypothetical protein